MGQQGGGEHVEGLAGSLLTEHTGGAVVAAPELDAVRGVGTAQAPADAGRVEPWWPCSLHLRLLPSRAQRGDEVLVTERGCDAVAR